MKLISVQDYSNCEDKTIFFGHSLLTTTTHDRHLEYNCRIINTLIIDQETPLHQGSCFHVYKPPNIYSYHGEYIGTHRPDLIWKSNPGTHSERTLLSMYNSLLLINQDYLQTCRRHALQTGVEGRTGNHKLHCNRNPTHICTTFRFSTLQLLYLED